MADPLVTLDALAVATQSDPTAVAADAFAQWVIEDLSDYARFLAGHDGTVLDPVVDDGVTTVPAWTIADAPYDVRRAVLMAAKRTYKNPDGEVQTGVGPISSRVLDSEAVVNAFTEAERESIEDYHPDGDPNGLWVQRVVRGDDPLPVSEVLYVPDDSQVGMTVDQSAYPSWDFPLFNPGDPGGEG